MIYFDNAATTFPKPPAVAHAVAEHMRVRGGNPGRGAHPLALAAAETVFDTRSEIASFFGSTKPENVVFTQNATHALNLAIFGTVKNGDHVLISNLEHNSVYRPVAELYRRGAASYSIFNALGDEEETLANLKKALRRNTRVVVTTHVSNVCPKVLPLAAISQFCRERGILHISDVSQSAGIYPVDMRTGADVICAPGHKGLYGPQGVGFCLFANNFDFARLTPTVFGGNGVSSATPEMGRIAPESFEGGTLPVPAIAGLRQGLHFVKKLGTEKIHAHESKLYEVVRERLLHHDGIKIYLPYEKAGSTLLLNAEGVSAAELAMRLARRGVCTRAGLHCAPLAHEALDTGGDAL
ncbi:MAG: aminotransferase class V-fold PLP-dependent enzyme, partial [Clostridia bacterium]|nr:aminotransferase class V-fold PLP-dependent enzyme [Clostridia bacterium]